MADAGWAFARELSDALLKTRPLGGSELFVNRNGSYYADPHYCGRLIEQMNVDLIRSIKDRVRAMREIERLRAALLSLTEDPPATLDEPDTDAEVIIKMRAIAREALDFGLPTTGDVRGILATSALSSKELGGE